MDGGLRLVSGGTDNHLCLVDLTPADVTGKDAEKLLEGVGLTVNKNSIPNEPRSPFVTSGIRVGSRCGHHARISPPRTSTRWASSSPPRCSTPTDEAKLGRRARARWTPSWQPIRCTRFRALRSH